MSLLHAFQRPRRPGMRRLACAVLLMLMAAEIRALDCSVSTSGVAFGVYDPVLTAPTDSIGNLSLRCVHLGGGAVKTGYTIALSAGGSGTYLQRLLRAGTATLAYNLYDDATLTRVWGNGTGGTGLVAGSILVNPGNFAINESIHPIYGRIPAGQPAEIGTYSDTIVVTVTF